MNDDEFIPTRRSLLSRLKNWEDQKSWQEFFDTYSKLIYRMAAKAGLTDAESQDVVQETVVVVAKKIPGFKYDPALGSFKSWLLLITVRPLRAQGVSGERRRSRARCDRDPCLCEQAPRPDASQTRD